MLQLILYFLYHPLNFFKAALKRFYLVMQPDVILIEGIIERVSILHIPVEIIDGKGLPLQRLCLVPDLLREPFRLFLILACIDRFPDPFLHVLTELLVVGNLYDDICHQGRIEYMSRRISDNTYVYVFRDIDENEKCRYNYQHYMELGRSGYTQEKFEQSKETFGVYVLQSNSAKSAEEVFGGYKKRWGIETLYQYMKNKADFNDLMIQDYYKEQGFAFLMLVTGQIHQKMITAVKKLGNNAISVHDILLMARCMKMERRGSNWNLKNARKRDLQILKQLGFEPKIAVIDS